MSSIEVGDRYYSEVSWRDADNALFDPEYVLFKIKNPAGTIVTYEYGVDAEVTRTSLGVYRSEWAFTSAGKWTVRWQSLVDIADEETATGADEQQYTVRATQFTSPIIP